MSARDMTDPYRPHTAAERALFKALYESAGAITPTLPTLFEPAPQRITVSYGQGDRGAGHPSRPHGALVSGPVPVPASP